MPVHSAASSVNAFELPFCPPCSLGELDKHLPNLLGGRTKTFVTPCVMHELRWYVEMQP